MATLQESSVNTSSKSNSYVTLVSNSRACVNREADGKISIFIDGNKFWVDEKEVGNIKDEKKNEWLEHFVEFYDKLIKKNEQKIDFYKKAEEAVKSALKEVKKWYDSILSFFGVQHFSDIVGDSAKQKEAEGYYAQISDYKMQKVGIGNRLFSCYMSGFNLALSKGKFNHA